MSDKYSIFYQEFLIRYNAKMIKIDPQKQNFKSKKTARFILVNFLKKNNKMTIC